MRQEPFKGYVSSVFLYLFEMNRNLVPVVPERFSFEKGGTRGGGRSERKNRVFFTKRQAVWFETQRVSS